MQLSVAPAGVAAVVGAPSVPVSSAEPSSDRVGSSQHHLSSQPSRDPRDRMGAEGDEGDERLAQVQGTGYLASAGWQLGGAGYRVPGGVVGSVQAPGSGGGAPTFGGGEVGGGVVGVGEVGGGVVGGGVVGGGVVGVGEVGVGLHEDHIPPDDKLHASDETQMPMYDIPPDDKWLHGHLQHLEWSGDAVRLRSHIPVLTSHISHLTSHIPHPTPHVSQPTSPHPTSHYLVHLYTPCASYTSYTHLTHLTYILHLTSYILHLTSYSLQLTSYILHLTHLYTHLTGKPRSVARHSTA